jgi:hypothetical protein
MRPARVISSLLVAGIVITAACLRQAESADPMPLFLAARQTDDDSSPQMRRAAQLRVDQRAAAIANANLKWKPYRPQVASATPDSASQPVAESQEPEVILVTSIEAVPAGGPPTKPTVESRSLEASPIATSDGELRFRRVIPRSSRGKLREDILRVSSDNVDPFAMPDSSESETEPPAVEETKPTKKTPAKQPPAELGEPNPIPKERDPFSGEYPDNTMPPPEEAYPDRRGDEPRFVSPAETPPATCEQDKRECEAALIKLRNTTLDTLSIDIGVTGREGEEYPCECPLTGEFAGRNWECSTFTWKASLACHKPLYFEEVALERYGHALNPLIGPVWSGAHFFLTIPTLPYQMSLAPPNECQYVLGYYRPGDCAPYLVPPIPLSIEAALIEAGSVVGGVFILR